MDIVQNDLCERYSKMETEELLELHWRGSLTEMARPLLENELRSRGVDPGMEETKKMETNTFNNSNVGFQWWVVWAWLGLTFGNLYMFTLLQGAVALAVTMIIVNSFLMIKILEFNKYAFLVATMLSMNPIIWIVNGIYLKRRWNHQRVNSG